MEQSEREEGGVRQYAKSKIERWNIGYQDKYTKKNRLKRRDHERG